MPSSHKDVKIKRRRLLQDFGNRKTCKCQKCKKTLSYETVTIDHILPQALGGTYARRNLRPLCKSCNEALGRILEGLLIPFLQMGRRPNDQEKVVLAVKYLAMAEYWLPIDRK